MKPQSINGILNFAYEKTTLEIKFKIEEKLKLLRRKVEEREERVARVRAEYKVTDEQIIDMLARARSQAQNIISNISYTITSDDGAETVTVGAGVINALLTERDFIESEHAQITKLELIDRNLRDRVYYSDDGVKHERVYHTLTQAELDYLGF